MRSTLLGLLAVAGCNEIWGLDRNVALAPGTDAPDGGVLGSRIRLTSQIAKTTRAGYVDQSLEYRPLDPPPAVQIGLVDGPLAPAEYDAVNGIVAYPADLVGKPWRLLYTLADGIPREVHWSPPEGDLVAHIVEPLFGRLPRMPVPAGGGYTITPIGATQHTKTRVFTTGIWTEGESTEDVNSATFDYDFGMKARSLSGPTGAPEAAWADHAVLADFRVIVPTPPSPTINCRVTSGVAAFKVPDMTPGMFTAPTPQPQYYFADKQVRLAMGGPAPIDARLKGLLGSRASGGANILRMEYGYVPSLGVFGFSKPVATPALEFLLPGPRMIALANCRFNENLGVYQSLTFADSPDIRDRFPPVVHVEVVNQRVKGMATLTSGFAGVLTSSDYNFDSQFLVAAATQIELRDLGGSKIADLDDITMEGTPVALGADPIELVFEVEASPLLVADSFDITLYSIAPTGKLVLQRVYTVTERRLRIAPAFLQADTEYVFELRAYRGRPDIARADFSVNTYPQYAATIFTRTFRTAP